jgi:hypothetical protein
LTQTQRSSLRAGSTCISQSSAGPIDGAGDSIKMGTSGLLCEACFSKMSLSTRRHCAPGLRFSVAFSYAFFKPTPSHITIAAANQHNQSGSRRAITPRLAFATSKIRDLLRVQNSSRHVRRNRGIIPNYVDSELKAACESIPSLLVFGRSPYARK